MKLKNKIFLYTTVLFVIIMIIISLTIYYTFSNITMNREIDRVEANANNIVSMVQGANSSYPVQDIIRVSVPTDGMIRVVSEDVPIISMAVSGDQAHLVDVPFEFPTGKYENIIDVENETYGVVQLPVIWENGDVVYLQLFESFETVKNNLNVLILVLLIVSGIAIIPIILSGKILSDIILTPIQSLIQTMNDIRKHNQFKHIPLEKHSNDELYTMSQTFNEMIDLLKENFERQEAFVSNASHELRTPLTVIESYANLLKRRGLERPEVVMESIEAIHSEALRMKDLTEQLLLLAKRDKDWILKIEETSLQDMLINIVNNVKRAYDREVELIIEENAVIRTDQNKLHQLLYIFIDNARKYSESLIHIKLYKKDEQAVIIIRDNGIGIPKESLNRIFDRFYRVDEARTRVEGGSGLGLAVAKEIADAIDVHIDLESEIHQGTTVILTINSLSSH